MNETSDWLKSIRNLPNTVKGIIGFVTVLIGFVLLFRENFYLSIVISVLSAFIAIFCTALYVYLRKRDSVVVGGGRVYQYPKLRRWALTIMILLPVIILAVLSFNSPRKIVSVAFLGTATPIPTPVPTVTIMPTKPLSIKVFHFQNFSTELESEKVGERFSGLILDELIKLELGVLSSKTDPRFMRSIPQMEDDGSITVINLRSVPPVSLIQEEIISIAPVVVVTGFLAELENDNEISAHIRLTYVDPEVWQRSLSVNEYEFQNNTQDMQILASEIAQEIYSLVESLETP